MRLELPPWRARSSARHSRGLRGRRSRCPTSPLRGPASAVSTVHVAHEFVARTPRGDLLFETALLATTEDDLLFETLVAELPLQRALRSAGLLPVIFLLWLAVRVLPVAVRRRYAGRRRRPRRRGAGSERRADWLGRRGFRRRRRRRRRAAAVVAGRAHDLFAARVGRLRMRLGSGSTIVNLRLTHARAARTQLEPPWQRGSSVARGGAISARDGATGSSITTVCGSVAVATSGGGSAFAAAGGGSATVVVRPPEVWSQPATPLPTTMAVRIAYFGML